MKKIFPYPDVIKYFLLPSNSLRFAFIFMALNFPNLVFSWNLKISSYFLLYIDSQLIQYHLAISSSFSTSFECPFSYLQFLIICVDPLLNIFMACLPLCQYHSVLVIIPDKVDFPSPPILPLDKLFLALYFFL